FWWCQREALETLVYLYEILHLRDFADFASRFGEEPKKGMMPLPFSIYQNIDGNRELQHYVPDIDKDVKIELPQENLLRAAFKMATGSGKTIVMAMVIVWAFMNRVNEVDSRFPANYLVVAPNVIVYERLERDFASSRIFYDNPLIPPEWRKRWNLKIIKRGDSAQPNPNENLFLINIQQIYESKEEDWQPQNALDAILGQAPNKDLASYQTSMLSRIMQVPDLMVINDEAHHVHDDNLEWNKTLLTLNDNLKAKGKQGLSMWLDFSATPKNQAGVYYPWVIVDYPLAQAIEDDVVKAPLIVKTVNKPDPEHVVTSNVWFKYQDWIRVAVDRWREHCEVFKGLRKQPILFIMMERTSFADRIGEKIQKLAHLTPEEVLVIHTDTKGNLTKKDLDEAREAAREVDKPESKVKIIVSVLMLREGWDVRNVTVILGLRPFSSGAKILPEQSIGRGLRQMINVSPSADKRQTLEVIGTQAFEDFVRTLELEGVGIDTIGEAPPKPVKIEVVHSKLKYDIAIPLTKPQYMHEYRNLDEINYKEFRPIFNVNELPEEYAINIELEFVTTGTSVHSGRVNQDIDLLAMDHLRNITNQLAENLSITGHFNQLYKIVKDYVHYKCFGTEVDPESDKIKQHLCEPIVSDAIAKYLSREIGQYGVKLREIEFEDSSFKLSQTIPFTWRRQRVRCKKTIFNECAIFNNLEKRFAEFLDNAPDIVAFAALAESFTRFKVDYLSESGAIRFYYPDFLAVQNVDGKEVFWILETKGREDANVALKEHAVTLWCIKISDQTGHDWRYMKVTQVKFDRFSGTCFGDLVENSKTLFTEANT
ncbi:MAG: DEAD/DEAH box helicase family protein, partial [Anaerolineaceae bacterium]|nr:DEAD/DEAH box helicase family protein [Anaerolineaceae bacterium]